MQKTKGKESIVGLKELRMNMDSYISRIDKGESITVVRRSQPIFKITPVDDDPLWDTVVDFTSVRKGGIPITEILSRL